MGKKLFGFHGKELGEPSLKIGVDGTKVSIDTPEPAKPSEMLHAVSVPIRGGKPQIYSYDNNEDGHRELANLIRGENVLAVILGHRIQIESTSTVELGINGSTVVSKTSITDR